MTEGPSWELPAGVTVRLLLVRHGQPEDSARGRCYGNLDVELSEPGREQMRRVARSLAGAPLVALYAGPRRRARESAEILARPHLPVRVDERLAEIHFGEMEGLTYDEVAEHYPDLYRDWMARPTAVRFPGGESFGDLKARVSRAAGEIRVRHRGGTVAIVTHAGVNRVLLGEALGLAAENVFRLEQSYAGVSAIDYYRETPVVRWMNAMGPPEAAT